MLPRRTDAVVALDALTSLRFVAALAVVFVHVPLLLARQLPDAAGMAKVTFAGQVGVGFFFILSGFVLTWSARAGDRRTSFYRRRVARIVPLHLLMWAATLVVYAVIGISVAAGPAAAAAVLVHSWVPVKSYFGAVDTPSWSLSCEMFFYALFPLLLPRVQRLDPRRSARLAVALVAVPVLAAAVAALLDPGSDVRTWLVVNAPPVRLAEFVLGIVVATQVRRGGLRRVSLPAATAATVAALVVVTLARKPELTVVLPVVPLAALVAAVAHRELAGGLAPLRHPWAVRLGQWSFALYLAHWPVLVIAGRVHRDSFGSASAATVAVLLVVATCVAVSGVLFTLFERPLERLLRPRHDVPLALREPEDRTGPAAVGVATGEGPG
jgi:peptidoglycan/LPS O-acetylase OafA/YrhL